MADLLDKDLRADRQDILADLRVILEELHRVLIGTDLRVSGDLFFDYLCFSNGFFGLV